MEHPRVTPVPGRSTIVIAGQELVMALGRPSECNKFDDLVDRFLKAALVCEKDYDRIDVAFDGYREAIFPFHALTGCDTFSFFAKHSKKTAWKAFAHHQTLLESFADGDLGDTTVKSVEKFICSVQCC